MIGQEIDRLTAGSGRADSRCNPCAYSEVIFGHLTALDFIKFSNKQHLHARYLTLDAPSISGVNNTGIQISAAGTHHAIFGVISQGDGGAANRARNLAAIGVADELDYGPSFIQP